MAEAKTLLRNFGQIYNNPVLLDHSVTAVCEGLNVALASFQGLYLQYKSIILLLKVRNFTSCISSLRATNKSGTHP